MPGVEIENNIVFNMLAISMLDMDLRESVRRSTHFEIKLVTQRQILRDSES